MVALHPGQTSTKDDRPLPAGLFGYQRPSLDGGGFFVDLFELSYRVVDADGVEVVPPTAVDVDRDSPTTDALTGYHQGLYTPSITVPGGSTSYGEWTIEWTFMVEDGDPELTARTSFTVVDPAHPTVDGYAQVQAMYDEGVPVALFAPARVGRALTLASRLFDEYTGRHFAPRLLSVDVDGLGGPIKQFEEPIVGLSDVRFTFTTFSPADLPIELGNLHIYNRHLRYGLLKPDDRDDPRVEFLRVPSTRYPRHTIRGDVDMLSGSVGFPRSQQNVRVEGVFGYTDPDGSAFGATPDLVREAVLRIAVTKVQPLWSATSGGGFMGVAGPLQREQTMDQSAHYADATQSGSGAYVGHFTGDPAVDQIISLYRRPPRLASTD